jgi:hypothetical protein
MKSPEPTSTPSSVAPGVAFEVERFEWTSRDRLELVGRWSGLRGHRFLRPTLDVQVEGERRRMLADLEHKPWAWENGQAWVAAFTWRGEPGNFDDAELTVSPDLAVQLPAPGGSVEHDEAQPATPAADRLPARRPRSAVLEAELAAALAEVERSREELEQTRTTHSDAAKELRERLRGEHAKIRVLETELEQTRATIALAEAAAAEDADRLRDERHAAGAERDAAMVTRDAALAEAEEARSARDELLQKLSAVEGERDALAEARDRARLERNAWMSRARAAATGRPSAEARAVPKPLADREPVAPEDASDPTEALGPPPEPVAAALPPIEPATAALPSLERRTIQIGERPGPITPKPPASPMQDRGSASYLGAWGPRLAAAVALAVFVVIVVIVLLSGVL